VFRLTAEVPRPAAPEQQGAYREYAAGRAG
jgi:hypothetical protein